MQARYATIAQSVEQRIRNAQVVRSIRIGGSIPGAVHITPHPGALAQLGARLTGSQEVTGSSPVCSTSKGSVKALPFFLPGVAMTGF